MGYIPKTLPGFTYTGECSTELRADWGWIIRLKTSGTLTITDRNRKVDVFLVGGGGGGANDGNYHPGGGGGGGYTKTVRGISLSSGTGYRIEVGQGGASNANGSASSAFGYQADGGKTANATTNQGGAGGSQSRLTQRGRLLLERFNAYEQKLRDTASELYESYFGGLLE